MNKDSKSQAELPNRILLASDLSHQAVFWILTVAIKVGEVASWFGGEGSQD
jgi:hypothetical protein